MKDYITRSLEGIAEAFRGYIDKYSVGDEILTRLAKDLGFSFDTYNTLANIDQTSADRLVATMSQKSNHPDIAFLVNEDEVLGYSLESPRVPLLNDEFMKRIISLVESCNEVSLYEKYKTEDDILSSVIIKKSEPIVVDLNTSVTNYDIGVLVVNNELEGTYCRLVVYINEHPYYLPASYYNTTASRYKRSTGNSAEALEVLILKVLDDLRGDDLKYKIGDFHLKYRVNKEILATYEEYNRVLNTLKRVPSIIDNQSIIESISGEYEEFEQKYSKLDDQKSSYIWRCTAIGDLSIGKLVTLTSIILNDLGAPTMEYYDIRELIGSYISTDRIAVEIASENK